MLNLANFLTLVRILTIPFFLVFLAYHRYWEALILFILGGVTDFLDGLAARLMHQQTALGAYLDPVADKLLVITSFVMLGLIDGIPMWLAVVVVSRDVVILLGFAVVYLLVEERMEVKPSMIGKSSTMLQLLTLGVALGLLHDSTIVSPTLMAILIAATAIATVLSGLQYLYRGLVWLQSRAGSITRLG
jgi:cardiolipin synthase (CMP-forming)